jgi:hypothetical protein
MFLMLKKQRLGAVVLPDVTLFGEGRDVRRLSERDSGAARGASLHRTVLSKGN